jgi:hypothetical protein
MYYVVYLEYIGYNLFTEEELPYLNDAYIEYSGNYEECINYLDRI